MSAVLSQVSQGVEVLPPLRPIAAAILGPGQTVIDADTGTITYEHKSRELLLAEAVAAHTEAADLAPLIDSPVMYEEAGGLLKKLTDRFKSLDEQRLASTKPLRDKVDEINDDYKPAVAKLKEAAEVVKGGMLSYDREVERKRQQTEAEARQRAAEERRRAEAEAAAARKRAEDEATAARLQAEQRAADERRIAEENAHRMYGEADSLEVGGDIAGASKLRSEANAILGIAEDAAQTALFEGEQIAAAAAANAEAEADAMTAVAQMVTPAATSIARPRASGVSTRKVYGASITDQKALLAHVLANYDALNHLVSIEEAKVNKLAQDQKERFSLPGCELTIGNTLAARRR